MEGDGWLGCLEMTLDMGEAAPLGPPDDQLGVKPSEDNVVALPEWPVPFG